jgi:hypothetical protein
LKHAALGQLHARLEGVTLDHSFYRERLLQTALRDPAIGLQPLKATHRMMDERDNASTRLSHLLDVWHDLLVSLLEAKFLLPLSCPPLISLGRNRCAKREGWLVSDARWQFIELFDSISSDPNGATDNQAVTYCVPSVAVRLPERSLAISFVRSETS